MLGMVDIWNRSYHGKLKDMFFEPFHIPYKTWFPVQEYFQTRELKNTDKSLCCEITHNACLSNVMQSI